MLGSPKKTLNGHSNSVTALEELSTGNLISGSLDTYAIVWNSTFAQINKFQALNGLNITCIKELSDGLIAGYDHSIYIWKITGLSTQSLVYIASNIIHDVLPCNQIMIYNSSCGPKCEYKIDVCENETCSNNGYCRDVNHLPVCECFYMYSGNRCEIESAQKRAYQVIISTSSIIAVSTVVAFYCLMLLNDVVSCLTNKASKTKKKPKIVHNKYIP
jgi:hypothetical protein